MNENTATIAKAVQSSLGNLLELVEQGGRGRSAEEVATLKEEAQKTCMAMIAAVVLADERYADGEGALASLMAGCEHASASVAPDPSHYARAWNSISSDVPHFFKAAVERDERLHTSVAREMVRELRIIGDTVCISNGYYQAVEHHIVRRYLRVLESLLTAPRSHQRSAADSRAEGWTSV